MPPAPRAERILYGPTRAATSSSMGANRWKAMVVKYSVPAPAALSNTAQAGRQDLEWLSDASPAPPPPFLGSRSCAGVNPEALAHDKPRIEGADILNLPPRCRVMIARWPGVRRS